MCVKYKIGYLDEDLKQFKKYERKLRNYFDVVGYDIQQGTTLKSLMEQIYNSDIDLLMIDYKLNETNILPFNGDVVESLIYDNKPLFPHIIFTNNAEDSETKDNVEDWKIIFDKTLAFSSEEEIDKFVTMLIKSIEQYKRHIASKKKILSDLLEKGEKEGLSSAEKSNLLDIQEELKNLDKTQQNEVPKHLISDEKIETLSKTRKEAEKFLQSLIDKSKKK